MSTLPTQKHRDSHINERIAHGPLFRAQFIALGLLFMITGGSLCALSYGFTAGIPLLVFGLITAGDIESVYLDFKAKKVRYYHNFLLFKIHRKTRDIGSYKTVSIGYDNNLNEFRSGSMDVGSYNSVIITFEMHLLKDGYKPFYLTEYGSHKEAVGLAIRLQEHMEVEILDLVEIAISKAMKKDRR